MKNNFKPLRIPYVYVILEKVDNTVKIGFSEDPERRLKELQIANSRPLEILQTFVGDAITEACIHAELKKYNVSGEWFVYSAYVKAVLEKYSKAAFDPSNSEFFKNTLKGQDPIYAYQNFILEREMSAMRLNPLEDAENGLRAMQELLGYIQYIIKQGKDGNTAFFQGVEADETFLEISSKITVLLGD